MKKVLAILTAVTLIFGSAVALAVPSKVISDLATIGASVAANGATINISLSAPINIAPEVIERQQLVLNNALANVTYLVNGNGNLTAAEKKEAAPVIKLTSANGEQQEVKVLSSSAALMAKTILMPGTQEDNTAGDKTTDLPLLGGLLETFGNKVWGDGFDAEEFATNPAKQIELLNNTEINEVVPVYVDEYTPDMGDVTATYELPTKYSQDEPVLGVMMSMPTDEQEQQAPTNTNGVEMDARLENVVPDGTMMIPLGTTVNEDGSVNITYSPEAMEYVMDDDRANALAFMSIPVAVFAD